jgi:retinol dehydrogenase-12
MAASLDGRVCIVTGANKGIGNAAAHDLAGMGATVILACRNPEAGEAARQAIEHETGNHNLSVMPLDLSSLASVRRFAADFTSTHDRLNVLVNNAGIYTSKRTLTGDGHERTWEVDYLSHFLLTNLLMDALKRGAPSRVINVSSNGHQMGRIQFDDLDREARWSGIRAYGQAKLAQILFTKEFARRFAGTGVSAFAVHPGAVRTDWSRGGVGMRVGARIAWPFMLTPKAGADTIVWLASLPETDGWSGLYFAKRQVEKPKADAEDPELARRLWEISEELTGLRRSTASAPSA